MLPVVRMCPSVVCVHFIDYFYRVALMATHWNPDFKSFFSFFGHITSILLGFLVSAASSLANSAAACFASRNARA